MSFLGGGTDFQPFFQEYGGAVLSTTFDKYCYVSIRHLPPFFTYKNQLTYSRIERTLDVDGLEHPMVRNAMKLLNMHDLCVSYDADLPARSGLGSSSTFAVALLNAFHAMKGQYASKEQLAREAIKVEREMCQESGGWQDQIAAAYGGMNRIDFGPGGFNVSPVIIQPDRKDQLNHNLLMFFTGFSRFSSDIEKDKVKTMKNQTSQLLEMKQLVDVGEAILKDRHGDLDEFGRLLDHTWRLKRGISNKVSTGTLDEIYEKAIRSGALGGKLLGAGGGGFFIFYVPEEYHESVKRALQDLLYIPFRFENSGAQILYYQPENYIVPKKGN